MAERFVGERNLRFLLHEVCDVEALTEYSYYAEHERDVFDLVLDTAVRMARDLLHPVLQEMDKNPPQFVDGQVKVHPVVREFLKQSGDGGWIGANFPFELGGQQLPITVTSACHFIMAAANYSASVYPLLCSGAAHLIEAFGSKELIDTYIPKMLSGEWQGTMALTEPQAGSSLSDVATRAELSAEGYYRIRGQKIFISAGDHDGCDNVIHLMLAKIRGGPAGVKGISLFVVPKKRPGKSGELVSNDVTVTALYHKLGYRGAPITQLSIGENGDCRGFLVGEPHRGLKYMFQMMNEARIEVGMGAAAIASAAYYASLDYARQRPQGRKPSQKDPASLPVPIIEHPDVKRMLLFQRSIVEGALSLILQCGKYADLAKVAEGTEKERSSLLLDLLTPVAKTFPSEMGLLSVSQGLQCLGGYGYCDEFPLELYYRDARIHPIHEGTTGIQGLDLLGRKILMNQGQSAMIFLEEIRSATQEGLKVSELKPYAEKLRKAAEKLQRVTLHLAQVAMKSGIDLALADATLYLEFFGLVAVAWQWLLQGLAAQKGLKSATSETDARFYHGKIHVMRYFYHYELPKIEPSAQRLMEADGLTVTIGEILLFD